MTAEPNETARPTPEEPETGPFELWLQQRLRQLHGAVVQEPVPAGLLRIIEEDRAKRER